jgi:hypothetical protein
MAIKTAALARERLAAHGQAIERAREQVAVAEAKLAEAEAAAAAAKSGFAEALANAVAAGRKLPSESAALRAADAKVVGAANVRDAVRTAHEKLKADLRNVEIDEHLSRNEIATAVDQVLAPLATQLLERAEAARRTLFQAAAVLNFLRAPDDAHRSDLFWKPNEWKTAWHAGDRRRAPMLEVNKQIENFLAKFRQDIDTGADATLARWRAARQALKNDSTAPLPELD